MGAQDSEATAPRQTRIALSVVAGVWTLLFGPFLLGGGQPAYRDLLVTYLPLRHFWAERVRAGHLPGWFPWEGLGQPFLGQGITSTFHPVNLLYLVFDDALALRLEMVSAVLVGLVGQVLLARRFQLSAPAAVSGALVLGLSGYTLSMLGNTAYLRGLCMLPWVALFAVRVMTERRPFAAVAGLAVSWALIPLGGDAATTLLAALVVAAMAFAPGRSRRVGWLLGGALLAALLAAPELLPAGALRVDSIVADFKNADFVARFWALHPERLPELVMPGFTPPARSWTQAAALGEPGRWAESVFLGVAVLAFAFSAPRQRVPMLFLALGVLGLWLALGVHGGLDLGLRRLVPALNSVRYPEKHLALAVFGLATAAAFGVEQALTHRRGLFLAVGGTAVAAVLLRLLLAPPDPQPANAALAFALATAAGTALVGGLMSRHAWAAWLAPLLLVLSLWSVPVGMLTVPPEEIPALDLTSGRVWVERSATGAPIDDDSLRAWVQQARGQLAGNLGALQHRAVFSLSANLPLEPKRERALFGWTLSDTRSLAPLYGYSLALRADGVNEVLPAAPRAWVASPVGMATATGLLQRLRAHPASALTHPLVGGALPPPLEGPVGEVSWVRDDVDELTLDAKLEQPGLLVLNDLAAAGWSVQVDGVTAPLLVVNALVRGVMLAPGGHRVVFSYEVPRLKAGLAAGALGLLAVLVLLLAGLRRAATS